MLDRDKLAIARGFLYEMLFAIKSNDEDVLEEFFRNIEEEFENKIKDILDRTASPNEPIEY